MRLAYLAWFCPYTLIEDEAHYWEWSRRLELSYYSKGPGVAWAIRAATELFGTSAWAVRVPAVVSGAIGAWCVAGLARDACATHPRATRAGLYAATIYLCMPAFWVLGIIITIDGPYLACWAAACWAAWRVLTTNSPRAWAALGLAIAIGFTFKYTILLLLPGLALAALLAKRDTKRALSVSAGPSPSPAPSVSAGPSSRPTITGPLLALTLASLGLIPVILWNAQHEWITVQHLLGHLGVKGGDIAPTPGESWSPKWTLELLATQIALAGPAMLLAVYSFICARRERDEHPDLWRAARFLACCGVPVLGFYILVSLLAEPEGNWPIAAWVSAARARRDRRGAGLPRIPPAQSGVARRGRRGAPPPHAPRDDVAVDHRPRCHRRSRLRPRRLACPGSGHRAAGSQGPPDVRRHPGRRRRTHPRRIARADRARAGGHGPALRPHQPAGLLPARPTDRVLRRGLYGRPA
ncbi:MAG: hypothetical protein HND58_00870 [Planctomycetota bacterium]|nr:MAG: hypothetical protein HND58_00870 [Planctomycetota bacterium]